MANYLRKRILQLIPVLLGISVVTFALSHLAPGDPAFLVLQRAGIEPTLEALEQIREEMGFNLPLWQQYFNWLWRVLHFDLGTSLVSNQPVTRELLERLPATLELTLGSLGVLLLTTFPLGVWAAVNQGRWPDHLTRILSLLGASLPRFWIGLMLIYYFSVEKRLLPVMGRGSLEQLILPSITLGLGMAMVYARLLRANLLEVFSQDYMKAARARGIGPWKLLFSHGLRNALLPMVTVIGMSVGYMLGGTAIIETVFSWPGIGKYGVESILNKDYPVIQGYVLLMAVIFVLINLIVDIIYCFLDPRIELAGKGAARRWIR